MRFYRIQAVIHGHFRKSANPAIRTAARDAVGQQLKKTNSQDRVLAVLDLFSESRPLWTPDELMRELGYTRPTLYRYLKSLKDTGLLMSTRGGRLTLGPRVVEMDYLSRRADPLVAAAAPVLDAGYPVASLCVTIAGQQARGELIDRISEEVREAAGLIAAEAFKETES